MHTIHPAPSARAGAASVWTGQQLFVWGGTATGSHVLADGALYDPARRIWQPLPAAPLAAGHGATTAWTGSELLICGLLNRTDHNNPATDPETIGLSLHS